MKWICKNCNETFNETPACIHCHSINCEPFDNTTKRFDEFIVDLLNYLAWKIGDKTRKEIILEKLSNAFNEINDVHLMIKNYDIFNGKSSDIIKSIQTLMEEINSIKI